MRFLLLLLVLASLLPAAPAVAQAKPELRAFWVDAFNSGIKSPSQVDILVRDARRAGANALFVQVRRRGDAYYTSSVDPRSNDTALAPAPYDPLRTVIDAAHAQGIEVHAWIATLVVWRTTLGSPPSKHVLASHGEGAPGAENWVMYDDLGAAVTSENDIWLDPGHPGVVEYTEQVARDILSRYPDLDGLQLDRIRYPSAAHGYNPVAVARFNAAYSRTGAPTPDDPEWLAWRRDQVTNLVRRVAFAAAELAPHARLSAAGIAWEDGPAQRGGWEGSAPYTRVLQDWNGWLDQGLVDTVVAMNYDREHNTAQRAYFDHWLAWELSEAAGEVMVGPAAYLNSLDGTLAQVARAQERGAPGIALYSYATSNKDGVPRNTVLDALAAGPFAGEAAPPPMTWKQGRGALSGTLAGASLPSASGIAVTLSGPEQRTVRTDEAGWFGAMRLKPGRYAVLVSLGSGRLLWADAEVKADGFAFAENWRVVEQHERVTLPLLEAGE